MKKKSGGKGLKKMRIYKIVLAAKRPKYRNL